MQRLTGILSAICIIMLSGSEAAAAPPALVAPTFFFCPTIQKNLFYDYRPAINAAGTRIVFERSLPGNGTLNASGYSNIINLYVADFNAGR